MLDVYTLKSVEISKKSIFTPSFVHIVRNVQYNLYQYISCFSCTQCMIGWNIIELCEKWFNVDRNLFPFIKHCLLQIMCMLYQRKPSIIKIKTYSKFDLFVVIYLKYSKAISHFIYCVIHYGGGIIHFIIWLHTSGGGGVFQLIIV